MSVISPLSNGKVTSGSIATFKAETPNVNLMRKINHQRNQLITLYRGLQVLN